MMRNARSASGSTGFLATALLSTLIVGVLAWLDMGTQQQGQRGSALLFYFESVFTFLPIAAGLVAAQTRRVSLRALIAVVVVTTGLMVAQDFLPPSELTSEKREVVYMPLTARWEPQSTMLVRWQEGGTLRIVTDYALGRFDRLDQPPPYGEAEQVLHVTYGVMKLGYLLLPFVIVGFVLGVRRWIAHNVMFRTRSGERLFFFVIAWVLAPAVPLIVWTISDMTRSFVTTAGWSLWAVASPYLVFAVLAALAWKGAVKAGTTGFDIDGV
jgi:hypothetical protein